MTVPTVPRLAGQQTPFPRTLIARYRDDTGIRSNQRISIATSKLKNLDIKAIADDLNRLPRYKAEFAVRRSVKLTDVMAPSGYQQLALRFGDNNTLEES
ncbi:MAG: hypothetical protein WBO95_02155 [Candidatus Dechloromonas phosphoritropha]